MNVIRRTWAIFVIVTKRLFSHRWLTLMTGVGLLTSVALTVIIPLYADAIYYRVLREELPHEGTHMTGTWASASASRAAGRSRPRFSRRSRLVSASRGAAPEIHSLIDRKSILPD